MMFIDTPDNPPPPGAEALELAGYRGVKLRACLTPAPGHARGTVLIFPGYTEYLEKYFETAADLQKRGFASFVMDWRGQGLSQRSLRNPVIFHLNNFDEPGRDIGKALEELEERLPRPWIVLAHSMGGAIALRALLKGRFTAEAALFSAPMWGIMAATPINRYFSRFMRLIGFGRTPTSFFAKKPTEEVFEVNNVTTDKTRFDRNWDIWRASRDIRIAGPTFGWFAAACDTVKSNAKRGALKKLKFPITVLSAGEEALVRNEAHAALAARLPEAEHRTIEGAKHELLQETDAHRAQVFEAFDDLMRRAGI